MIARSKVDFPDPLEPTTHTVSRGRTFTDTPVENGQTGVTNLDVFHFKNVLGSWIDFASILCRLLPYVLSHIFPRDRPL